MNKTRQTYQSYHHLHIHLAAAINARWVPCYEKINPRHKYDYQRSEINSDKLKEVRRSLDKEEIIPVPPVMLTNGKKLNKVSQNRISEIFRDKVTEYENVEREKEKLITLRRQRRKRSQRPTKKSTRIKKKKTRLNL